MSGGPTYFEITMFVHQSHKIVDNAGGPSRALLSQFLCGEILFFEPAKTKVKKT